jgi:hypothetical protein
MFLIGLSKDPSTINSGQRLFGLYLLLSFAFHTSQRLDLFHITFKFSFSSKSTRLPQGSGQCRMIPGMFSSPYSTVASLFSPDVCGEIGSSFIFGENLRPGMGHPKADCSQGSEKRQSALRTH